MNQTGKMMRFYEIAVLTRKAWACWLFENESEPNELMRMEEEDKEISLMFDDLNRSTAIFKLAMWKKSRNF